MAHAARSAAASAGLVAWGWFAFVGMTDGKLLQGGEVPGGEAAEQVRQALALRADTTKGAFWAAWWTVDPRKEPEAPPDDMGVIVGARAHAEAIGEADAAIRRAKGLRVFVISIGEHFARRAYREGVRRKTSSAEGDRAAGKDALAYFGLDESVATIVDVRRAFRTLSKKAHPDKGGSAEEFQALKETTKAAEDYLRLLELDRQAGARARGERLEVPAKRKRKKAPRPEASA